jgi:hypothetical protein
VTRPASVPLTGWRRVANAIWRPPSDPQIHGLLEVDATGLLAFLARADAAGLDVTPTHLVGRAVAYALGAVPALNVRLNGGRATPRRSIDVFFITAVAGGRDLTGVKVNAVDRLSAVELGEAVREGADRLRRGHDPGFERAKSLARWLPLPLLRAGLRAAAIAAGDHGWSIPALGVHAEPFGSAMVSSLGSFGLPVAFVPIAWMYRVPLIVAPGVIAAKPVAVGGRVEVRPVLPIAVTIDHRWVDGAQLMGAVTAFREYLEDPAAHEPTLGYPRSSAAADCAPTAHA